MRSSRAPVKLALTVLLFCGVLSLRSSDVQKPALPNIRIAAYFTGADAGAQITACIADLPATGGTCDARGLEGAQSATATITIPANTTLLLGMLTLSSGANPVFDITGNGAALIGLSSDIAGTEILNTGTGNTLRIGTVATIRNIRVERLHLDGNSTAAIGITMSNAGDLVVEQCRIVGHLDDSIRIDDGIHIMLRGNRVSADAAHLAGAYAINIGPSNPNTTTVSMYSNYFEGYTALLNNNGAATTSVGNIYESSTTAIVNSSNNLVSISDAFETFTTAYDFNGDATALVIYPNGVSASQLDYAGMTDHSRITVILPITTILNPTIAEKVAATNTTVLMNNGGSTRLILGIPAANDQLIPGTVANDTVYRSTQKQVWSTDSGTTRHMQLDGSGLQPLRIRTVLGTALVAGDFALSAGWGATASIGTITGTDQRFRATITSAGAGLAANPTVTLTFTDGTWTTAPFYSCSRGGGDLPSVQFQVSATATALTLTFLDTPIAAQTYTVTCVGLG